MNTNHDSAGKFASGTSSAAGSLSKAVTGSSKYVAEAKASAAAAQTASDAGDSVKAGYHHRRAAESHGKAVRAASSTSEAAGHQAAFDAHTKASDAHNQAHAAKPNTAAHAAAKVASHPHITKAAGNAGVTVKPEAAAAAKAIETKSKIDAKDTSGVKMSSGGNHAWNAELKSREAATATRNTGAKDATGSGTKSTPEDHAHAAKLHRETAGAYDNAAKHATDPRSVEAHQRHAAEARKQAEYHESKAGRVSVRDKMTPEQKMKADSQDRVRAAASAQKNLGRPAKVVNRIGDANRHSNTPTGNKLNAIAAQKWMDHVRKMK